MTPTEFQLFVTYRDTVIPVDSICEKYLNLTPPEARRRALLNKLPFPKHLSRVPEIASAHHETIVGTGYPRKLCGEDMTLQAKILAIADIF